MSQLPAIAILFAVAVVGFMCAVTAADDTPPFKIATKRDNDTVEVRADKEKTVFIVKSPSGISNATIEQSVEKWPDAVTIRMHLKGLENFQATNGKVTLNASVSSQDGTMRHWQDGKEDAPLDAKSPLWMEIRMIGGDGKPSKAIPLKNGFFEMALPRAFFEANPKAITVSWIDFYRN